MVLAQQAVLSTSSGLGKGSAQEEAAVDTNEAHNKASRLLTSIPILIAACMHLQMVVVALLRTATSSMCSADWTSNHPVSPSDSKETDSIQISVNRLRSAADSSFLPKSFPGFIVHNNRKSGAATTVSSPGFSASVMARKSTSSNELSRSITESSAKLTSSSNTQDPLRAASTRGPSFQANLPAAAGPTWPSRSPDSKCW